MDEDESVLDPSKCLVCYDNLNNGENYIKRPTAVGLETLYRAAAYNNDDVFKRFKSRRDDILSLTLFVSYHTSCRTRYTLKYNQDNKKPKRVQESQDENDNQPSTSACSEAKQPRLSRSTSCYDFNIREHCFVCSKSDLWKEKLTPVSTGTGESTRMNILRAAELRFDDIVRGRMIAYPDLFAFDAKYHRTCYTTYVSERNIQAHLNKLKGQKNKTAFQNALDLLAEDLDNIMFSNAKDILELSHILSMYVKHLNNIGCPYSTYSTSLLKRHLKQRYGNKISFMKRTGYSDLVCSSDLCLSEIFHKYASLNSDDSDDEIDLNDLVDNVSASGSVDEKRALHTAAGILRTKLRSVVEDKDQYLAAEEINLKNAETFVPAEIQDFISWLTVDGSYDNISSCKEILDDKVKFRVLALCQFIIGAARNIRTPITLGVGVQMHHDFGSKQVVNTLLSLGVSVSYDEVRRFLGSLAETQRTTDEVYIPSGLLHTSKVGAGTVVAAIDNFDRNEETLDGKNTTHSMALVVYQRNTRYASPDPIPRRQEKSLQDPTDFSETDVLHVYTKPQKKPEPPVIPAGIHIQKDPQLNESKEIAEAKDMTWLLSRYVGHGDIPGWKMFNTILCTSDGPLATIRYLPMIHASPTDMSTIYTSMVKLVKVAETLGQNHICITADLSIYSKAQEILWNKPPLLDGKVTMRLGAMHLCMAVLASIGKLYSDGGLYGLLTQSGVYADNSCNLMMQGKQLQRGIRAMTLALETFSILFLDGLLKWKGCGHLSELMDNLDE